MFFASWVTLAVAASAYAVVVTGPNSNLHIVNKVIQPDGFNRSYVKIRFVEKTSVNNHFRTVLAGTTAANAAFPGPLITGFKVSSESVLKLQNIDAINLGKPIPT